MVATGRLRQLRPARISRSTTAQSATGKARSSAAAGAGPIHAETPTAARPEHHKANRTPNCRPHTGNRPVQFGMAVSRNPVITAVT